ncbi:universal stress protein [Halalkalicoccus salilacus]|uniref:universal stress protein n=1 Tax=Halalkalicoccus salilacus TaxID=3117459 RepID=UPI00300E9357
MFSTLLLTTDGSEAAEKAAPYAIKLANTFDATVYVLYVVESDAESTEQLNRLQAVQFEGTTELHKRAAGAIDRIRSYTDEAGVEIEPVIKVGTPVNGIVGFAENNAIDTINMTSQGRGGVKQTLLGSVTERVARRTTVPVLIIDSKGQSEGVSSEHDPDR